MFLGPPSSVMGMMVSAFQTEPFLGHLLPKPFPLTTVCSVSVSKVTSCSQAQPSIFQPRELREKSAEASAAYYVGEGVHRCGQVESSRPVGSGSQLGQLLDQQTQGQDISPGQVVSKHLERQVTVFRSQHGPVEGSQARLHALPFWTHYDWW